MRFLSVATYDGFMVWDYDLCKPHAGPYPTKAQAVWTAYHLNLEPLSHPEAFIHPSKTYLLETWKG